MSSAASLLFSRLNIRLDIALNILKASCYPEKFLMEIGKAMSRR